MTQHSGTGDRPTLLVVRPTGQVDCLYDEVIDLAALGTLAVQRASHVEPDEQGRWWADLAPVDGPKLGPVNRRSSALDAERQWLERMLLEQDNQRSIPTS
jgi:hypothetical protein